MNEKTNRLTVDKIRETYMPAIRRGMRLLKRDGHLPELLVIILGNDDEQRYAWEEVLDRYAKEVHMLVEYFHVRSPETITQEEAGKIIGDKIMATDDNTVIFNYSDWDVKKFYSLIPAKRDVGGHNSESNFIPIEYLALQVALDVYFNGDHAKRNNIDEITKAIAAFDLEEMREIVTIMMLLNITMTVSEVRKIETISNGSGTTPQTPIQHD